MKQHKPLAGQASLIPSLCKHLLTVLLFFFFIRCLLSLMNVFISGPELTSSKILLSVWDWGGGRTPYFMFIFCFGDFKLRIKTYKTAINQNMWRWHFWDFFFQHNDGLWHFNIIFLSCIWQSVGLFYVSHSVGVLCPYVCEFSLNVHQGRWTLTPVCIHGHRPDAMTCLCNMEATVPFYWALPGRCHSATFLRN